MEEIYLADVPLESSGAFAGARPACCRAKTHRECIFMTFTSYTLIDGNRTFIRRCR